MLRAALTPNSTPRSVTHGWRVVASLIVLLLLGGCQASAMPEVPSPAPVVPDTGESARYFSIVALGDTQFYSWKYPHVFDSQTRWIRANAERLDIVMTVHLGDLVEHADSSKEWANARHAMDGLAGLPYSVIPGNHDIYYRRGVLEDMAAFNAAFPCTEFARHSWYGGHYPGDGNENSYAILTACDVECLVVNLKNDPDNWTLEWAAGVLRRHSSLLAVVVTHDYLDEFGGRSPIGRRIWSTIRSHENVRLVLCGHVHGTASGAVRSASVGDRGNVVHELMSDYSGYPVGGYGYMRIVRFYPYARKLEVQTYSSAANSSLADSANQFTLPLTWPAASPA